MSLPIGGAGGGFGLAIDSDNSSRAQTGAIKFGNVSFGSDAANRNYALYGVAALGLLLAFKLFKGRK